MKHEFSVISGQKYPQEDAYALIFKDETGVEIEYAARIIRVIPPINTVPINRFVFIVPEWDAE